MISADQSQRPFTSLNVASSQNLSGINHSNNELLKSWQNGQEQCLIRLKKNNYNKSSFSINLSSNYKNNKNKITYVKQNLAIWFLSVRLFVNVNNKYVLGTEMVHKMGITKL